MSLSFLGGQPQLKYHNIKGYYYIADLKYCLFQIEFGRKTIEKY
jgi:hypothetical protein